MQIIMRLLIYSIVFSTLSCHHREASKGKSSENSTKSVINPDQNVSIENVDPDQFYLVESELAEDPIILASIAAELGTQYRPIHISIVDTDPETTSTNGDDGSKEKPLNLATASPIKARPKPNKARPSQRIPKTQPSRRAKNLSGSKCVYGSGCNKDNKQKISAKPGDNTPARLAPSPGVNPSRPKKMELDDAKAYVTKELQSLGSKVPGFGREQLTGIMVPDNALKPFVQRFAAAKTITPKDVGSATRDVVIEQAWNKVLGTQPVSAVGFLVLKEAFLLKKSHPEAAAIVTETCSKMIKSGTRQSFEQALADTLQSPESRQILKKALQDKAGLVARNFTHGQALGLTLGKLTPLVSSAMQHSGAQIQDLIRLIDKPHLTLTEDAGGTVLSGSKTPDLKRKIISLVGYDQEGNYYLQIEPEIDEDQEEPTSVAINLDLSIPLF